MYTVTGELLFVSNPETIHINQSTVKNKRQILINTPYQKDGKEYQHLQAFDYWGEGELPFTRANKEKQTKGEMVTISFDIKSKWSEKSSRYFTNVTARFIKSADAMNQDFPPKGDIQTSEAPY